MGAPVKVVVNCAAQSIAALLDEADVWDAKGRPDNAAKVRRTAKAAMIEGAISDPHGEAVRLVPLTADEKKQRAQDSKDHAARTAAEEQAVAERAALAARFASGKATPAEVQQALAQLLG